MTACPPPDQNTPCAHTDCTFVCIESYHNSMVGCVSGTCGSDIAPRECLLECYTGLHTCLGTYAPDYCGHYAECLESMNNCNYYCATAYFPCIDHPDCQ
jgi:hypothetical protein